MKHAYIAAMALAAMTATASNAQGTKVYKCPGNSYTNSEAEAKSLGCKLMDGGHVTIVEGTKPNGGATRVATAPTQANGGPRVDSEEQKQRDNDARAILEAELKKAEARQADMVREYNNGDPEKLGPEHKNHQKWVERTAELKASIARNENDIAGLKRELSRLNGGRP